MFNDAYLAGLLEGEGAVTLVFGPGCYIGRIRVSIAQSHLPFIQELQADIGGAIAHSGPQKSICWKVWLEKADEVQRFLSRVVPHLKMRNEEVAIAIAICTLVKAPGEHYTEQEKLVRIILQDRFTAAQEKRKKVARPGMEVPSLPAENVAVKQ